MNKVRGSCLLGVFVAAATLLGAPGLGAQEPADSAARARLRTRLATLERARVLTLSSLIEIEQPRLTLDGVTWSALRLVGEAADTPAIAAPLPLAGIRRIQARRPPIIPAVALGMIAGAAIGMEVMDASLRCVTRRRGPECEHNIRSLLGYIALGAAVGVAVSWRLPRWETIWPS